MLLRTLYGIEWQQRTQARAVNPARLGGTEKAFETWIIIAERGLAEKLGARVEPARGCTQQAWGQSDEEGRTIRKWSLWNDWPGLAADLAPVDLLLAVSLIGDVLAGRLRCWPEDAFVVRVVFPWLLILRWHAVRYRQIPSDTVRYRTILYSSRGGLTASNQ